MRRPAVGGVKIWPRWSHADRAYENVFYAAEQAIKHGKEGGGKKKKKEERGIIRSPLSLSVFLRVIVFSRNEAEKATRMKSRRT